MRDTTTIPMFCRRATSAAPETNADATDTLKAWIARRVRADLCDPVRVDPRHRSRVTFMCGIEIRINRRRRTISVRGRNGPTTHDWLHGSLYLDRPFSGAVSAQAWWWCVRQALPSHLRVLGDALVDDELPVWILHAARHSRRVRQARRQLVAALHLNARLLARARALRHDGRASSHDYVRVWQHQRASQQRLRESPRLWPLYSVLDCPPTCDLGFVRHELRRSGLSKGGWKVLCRYGRALWWPMRHGHEFGCHAHREIIELANLVAALGSGRPPAALVSALGRLASLKPYYGTSVSALRPPVRAAWWHYDTLPLVERAAFARGPVEEVLTRWMMQTASPKPPPNANWTWFERWSMRDARAQADSHVRWCTFGRRTRIENVVIAPLKDQRAVRAVGIALRNCMARCESHDYGRHVALFEMRDIGGRALAMFSANPDGGDQRPREIRGRYNRAVDARLNRIACAYLRDAAAGSGKVRTDTPSGAGHSAPRR